VQLSSLRHRARDCREGNEGTVKKTLRILSYYTIALVLLTVVGPLFTTVVGDDGLPWQVILMSVSFVPVLALAGMVLGGPGGRVRRTALWSCAGYTAVVFLIFAGLWFTPPFDPFELLLASLYLPVVSFAGLTLVALKRGAV
jgi:hypothetical protein